MQPTASREIVGFLTVLVVRSRQLNGNPLGGCHQYVCQQRHQAMPLLVARFGSSQLRLRLAQKRNLPANRVLGKVVIAVSR